MPANTPEMLFSTKMIKELIEKYGEFIRFCIVGVICTALDAVIFYAVRNFASYQVSLISGYILSLIANYFLTIYWTFKVKSSAKNAIGVVVAHLFNLFVVRMSLMWVFTSILLLDDRIAYIPTLLISVITNFVIVKLVINKTR